MLLLHRRYCSWCGSQLSGIGRRWGGHSSGRTFASTTSGTDHDHEMRGRLSAHPGQRIPHVDRFEEPIYRVISSCMLLEGIVDHGLDTARVGVGTIGFEGAFVLFEQTLQKVVSAGVRQLVAHPVNHLMQNARQRNRSVALEVQRRGESPCKTPIHLQEMLLDLIRISCRGNDTIQEGGRAGGGDIVSSPREPMRSHAEPPRTLWAAWERGSALSPRSPATIMHTLPS